MKKIERRAQEYAKGICPNNEMGQVVRSTAYAMGALDERRELIEKACRFFHEHFWSHPHADLICAEWGDNDVEFMDMFVKYMEE
jgi:hypothetical protein